MHPHPQDGSPGSFPDAGCVTNHLGLIGISYKALHVAIPMGIPGPFSML